MSGTVEVSPSSTDQFYRKGAPVRLTATPSAGWEFVRWTGSKNSFSPSIGVAMNRPMHFDAEFSRARRVVAGSVHPVVLPPDNYPFKVFDRESGFRIHVPETAVELRVRFESATPGAEVDLFVHTFSDDLSWNYGPDGRTLDFRAEFKSESPGSRESVTISGNSTPPLEPGRAYYISLVRFGSRMRVSGSLVSEVRVSSTGIPSIYANPRGFTFVAPFNAEGKNQLMRLENRGIGPVAFEIASERGWLLRAPVEGMIDPGQVQEVFVAADPLGLPSETHVGTLVVTASTGEDAIPAQEVLAPVTLVVLEADGHSQIAPDDGSADVTSPRLLDKVEP